MEKYNIRVVENKNSTEVYVEPTEAYNAEIISAQEVVRNAEVKLVDVAIGLVNQYPINTEITVNVGSASYLIIKDEDGCVSINTMSQAQHLYALMEDAFGEFDAMGL